MQLTKEKSQKYFKRQQDYLGHVNGQVEEVYSGLTVVKAFNGENNARTEFAKENITIFEMKQADTTLEDAFMKLIEGGEK